MNRTLPKSAAGAAICVALGAGIAALPPRAVATARSAETAGALPTLTAPGNGATVKKGARPPVFYAYGKGFHGPVFIELTSRQLSPHHTGLAPAPGVSGFYGQMKSVKGHPGRYMYTPAHYNFPSSWIEKGGTYHVQLNAPRPGESNFGPVSTIHVR